MWDLLIDWFGSRQWEPHGHCFLWTPSLLWTIWQVANPTLADVVEVEPDLRIYRDTGIALTKRGQMRPEAKRLVEFLASAEGQRIFVKWGWMRA